MIVYKCFLYRMIGWFWLKILFLSANALERFFYSSSPSLLVSRIELCVALVYLLRFIRIVRSRGNKAGVIFHIPGD